MKIVVDTNIVFSGILSPNGTISDLLLNSSDVFEFFAPSFILEELHNHTSKLLKLSKLTFDDLNFLKRLLLKKIDLIDVDFLSKSTWDKANKLTSGIDEFDTPFIALSLELDAPLWTGDKKLINGLKQKGIDWILNTKIINEIRKVK